MCIYIYIERKTVYIYLYLYIYRISSASLNRPCLWSQSLRAIILRILGIASQILPATVTTLIPPKIMVKTVDRNWTGGWSVRCVEAVMFLFNVVNLNVWLFLSVNLAKCFVGAVWLMFVWMRVGYVEVVVVLLYEIVSINVHLMFDAFFVSFHCIFPHFTFTNWTFQRFFLFIT